jgi:hypothetical protein
MGRHKGAGNHRFQKGNRLRMTGLDRGGLMCVVELSRHSHTTARLSSSIEAAEPQASSQSEKNRVA